MPSTVVPSSTFRLILNALDAYAEQTGIDLTTSPFADKLQGCNTPDSVLELLQDKANAFREFREGNRKLISWLSPVVQTLHVFSGVLGEAASLVPFQPAKAIFVGVDALLTAASGVSASYDALADLFECIGNFLKRLRIYAEVPFTPTMTDIIVKIMVEILSVLSLATKQIKQGRLKKFAMKLLGENEIEAVLQRLDRLTQEEARMTAAQTLEVVYGLVNNMKVVMDDGKASMGGIRQTLITMQEAANEINKMKREQLQEKIRNWFSPPDPSKNHIIARRDHHGGTAAWFTQGNMFEKWKATGSLLWIHGKPGSGKSILCSTIIQEAKIAHDVGLALIAYFYFDFRDAAKQDFRGLLTSLLSQLSAKSDPCYNILSDLYSEHNAGSQQPDDDALMQCLKDMIELPRQPAIYIIVDALDECPNTSGIVSPRELVLEFLEKFVELHLPNLHICVTSRPEVDIHDVLEPLASYSMSLHNESGQKKDIIDYISSVVQSDRKMRKWRVDDKKLVIDTLSQKADGMFRWVVCQIETLRRSFPAAIRRALDELPETLDETYERTLLGIEKERREYAHRLFQCLTVSIRPLRVEELGEVLAVRFDAGEIPQYHVDWRPEDAQEAVLSACSSLITVVNVDGSMVVQFSHFSVKEFLTSDRLATAGEDLSRYHVLHQSAHTTLARASLSVLVQLGDHIDKDSVMTSPLIIYAAQHWVDHGQFGNVSSKIQDDMERLFALEKPYFQAWVWIYDIDRPWREHMSTMHPTQPEATSLYYAVLCGFHSLTERLVVTSPRNVNARGGYYVTPLHAAFAKGHIDLAILLLEHGADIDALDDEGSTVLHKVSQSGRHDLVKLLLEHHADVNIQNEERETPLNLASGKGEIEVVRVLLQHDADMNILDKIGWTPLMTASRYGHDDVVRLLIENGAAVDPRDNEGWTPLQAAARYRHLDIVRFLLDNGADVNSQKDDLWAPLHQATLNFEIAHLLVQHGAVIDAKNEDEETPLDMASGHGSFNIVSLLIEHGAKVDSLDKRGWSPFHTASRNGNLDILKLLLQNGVDVNGRNGNGETPLDLASGGGKVDVARFLIENEADLHSRDKNGWTPLHSASRSGHLDVVKLLLQHGVDVNLRNGNEETPLSLASLGGNPEVARFLIENGGDVDLRDSKGWTPLHSASYNGHLDVVKLLISHGVDVNGRNSNEEIPLDLASGNGKLEVARLLIENGSNIDSQDAKGWTPLHSASWNGHLNIVKLLCGSGADVGMRNGGDQTPFDLASSNGKLRVAGFLRECMVEVNAYVGMDSTALATSQNEHPALTPSSLNHWEDTDSPDNTDISSLHTASEEGDLDVVQSLLDRGANINERNASYRTPLFLATFKGRVEVVNMLLEHGAVVDSRDASGWTPLHVASRFGHLDAARLLLDHGADVNTIEQDQWTPLHLAACNGYIEVVQMLIKQGATIHVRNDEGRTPSQVALSRGEREIAQLLSEHGARRK